MEEKQDEQSVVPGEAQNEHRQSLDEVASAPASGDVARDEYSLASGTGDIINAEDAIFDRQHTSRLAI